MNVTDELIEAGAKGHYYACEKITEHDDVDGLTWEVPWEDVREHYPATYEACVEGSRATLEAALSASPAGVVKPLEWEHDEEGWYSVQTVCGPYEARVTDRGAVRIRKPSEAWQAFEGNIEAAFAFLFADYSARIMSAIEPAGVGVESENRLLEKLKVMRGVFAMQKEEYTSRALHNIITEFEASRAALKGDEQ